MAWPPLVAMIFHTGRYIKNHPIVYDRMVYALNQGNKYDFSLIFSSRCHIVAGRHESTEGGLQFGQGSRPSRRASRTVNSRPLVWVRQTFVA